MKMLKLSTDSFFGVPIDSELLGLLPSRYVPWRKGSCAVVGSAGHLLGSGLGVEIDAHDQVFRFNEAPTATFEPDVGSRTTLRIIHHSDPIRSFLHSHWTTRAESERETLVIYASGRADVDDFRFLHANLSAASAYAASSSSSSSSSSITGAPSVYLLSPQLRLLAWRLVSTRGADKTPTSGFMGVLLALYSCDSVRTFGFGPYFGPRRLPHLDLYRYFSSWDQRPFAFGHKWGVEEALHAHWAHLRLLTRVYDRPLEP